PNLPFANISQLGHEGHMAYDQGRDLQAISLLKKAIQLDRHNQDLYTNLAAEDEISNFISAIYYYQKSLNIDPESIAALVGIGGTLQKIGHKNGTAIRYLKDALYLTKALAEQPINNTITYKSDLLERAIAFIYLGNYSQALDLTNRM